MKSDDMSVYATLDKSYGGAEYRVIAEKMTASGYKMNHSAARGIFLRALQKIAEHIYKNTDVDATKMDVKDIVNRANFQRALQEILHEL